MAFDERTAIAMRDVARLEQRVAKLEDALFGVLKWDEARGYIVPYRVRDPILAILNERPNGVAPTVPAKPAAWLHYDPHAIEGEFPWVLMVNQDHPLIQAKTDRIVLLADGVAGTLCAGCTTPHACQNWPDRQRPCLRVGPDDFVEHTHPEYGPGFFCTPDVHARIVASGVTACPAPEQVAVMEQVTPSRTDWKWLKPYRPVPVGTKLYAVPPDGVEVRPSAIAELRERIAAERNAGVALPDGGQRG